MSRTIGIIGLPNVGKSTIFNSLTNEFKAIVSNYPFCTIEPNIGLVRVPDERLARLNQLIKPKELTPTTIKFMDLAGLIKGSSHGEGLGNRFLASAREADALLHVVRCFDDSEITHVEKDLNPERDIDTINIELCLADLEMVEKRLEKVKNASCEVVALEEVRKALESGKMLRNKAPHQKFWCKGALPLFTLKPVIYLANLGEENFERSGEFVERITRKAFRDNAPLIKMAGKLESELKKLPEEEQDTFRQAFAFAEEKGTPLKRLVQVCYNALDLVTFYTTFREKLSAWSLKKGEKMLQAAGKVHGDMEQGFIKAEVINFKEFVEIGSYNLAREKGCIKIVGRDYLVQDGDIIYIHFAKRKT